MQNLDNRLSSFSAVLKPKLKAKRAFPLSPSSHPHLTPRALADAGFYHTPGPDEGAWDNCTCFLCNLELGGWDEEDDPFEEHAKRAGCAWAEMVCAVKIEKRKRDQSNGMYSTIYETPDTLPQSAESIEVRVQTFKKWWPHKQKAGWLPSVKALARAGFVYNPSTDSKDAVICPYCEYGVEGWEATDDPWAIHQSKVPDCHFFRAILKESAPAVPEKANKPAGRPKKSEAAKKPKRGTTVAPEPTTYTEPEPSDVEADADAAAEEPAVSQVSAASRRATRSRATMAKPKGGRGKKTETVELLAVDEVEVAKEPEVEEEPEAEVEEPVKKPRGKAKAAVTKSRAPTTAKGKGKKKAVVAKKDEIGEEEEGHVELEVPTESETKVEPAPEPESEPESEAQPTPKPAAKPSSRVVTKPSSQSSRSATQRAQPPKPSSSSQTSKPLPSLPPPSSTPVKSPSPTPAPRPLSQLDRFANIPLSSPIATPRAKATLRSAQPGRPSPHTTSLPRDALDASVTRGALQARKVVDDLFSSPLLPTPKGTAAASPARSPTPRAPFPSPYTAADPGEGPVVLTEEQKKMTVEDLVRAEMRRGYETLSREGEDMIEKFMEQTRKDRMKIEAL